MTNFGAKILNNSISALRAQQAVIATIGNNIANVNTPGYSRRTLRLESAGTTNDGTTQVNVGNGVRIGGLVRVADAFTQRLLLTATSDKAGHQVQNEFLTRIEKLFNLTGERQTIGSSLTEFFTALNDLSANPSIIELRSNLMQRAQDVVNSIKDTYNGLANLQTEADQRLSTEVNTVNALTEQIAQVNLRIQQAENGGTTVAADERDLRDQLMKDLAEKISFSSIEVPDGTVSITLANGFTLVHGDTARELSVTASPEFNGSPSSSPSLAGGALNYITYNHGTETVRADLDLTGQLVAGGGSIGGLLLLRGYNDDPSSTTPFEAKGIIPDLAAQVESITRSLLTDFNQRYQGPDLDPDPLVFTGAAADLVGDPPEVFGFFDFDYSGTKDATSDGRPDPSDLNSIGLNNYSSHLMLSFTEPDRFAAAIGTVDPSDPAKRIIAKGDARNITGDALLNFDGLAHLQSEAFPLHATASALAMNAGWSDYYNLTVGEVGNLMSTSDVALSVSGDNLDTISTRRDEISAVSLDEEFTNLITYQKAYQASARMIRVADELLQQVVELI